MSKYGRHQLFLKKVLLHVQKKYNEIRLWEVATGQAYAKFSVKDAIKYAIRTKDLMGALKKLIIIAYGKKGHPDLTGIFHGVWVGIEIKTGKARQSQDQKNFQAMIEKANGVYIVVSDRHSIESQIKKLERIEQWANNVKS